MLQTYSKPAGQKKIRDRQPGYVTDGTRLRDE